MKGSRRTLTRPEASTGGRDERCPVILVVAEDFGPLVEPLRWLADAGYDVRACLGPLAADRVCGLFEGGCPELEACDLLLTNDPPHHPPRARPAHEVLREARLRREQLPIVFATEGTEGIAEAVGLSARIVRPSDRTELLGVVGELIGPPRSPG